METFFKQGIIYEKTLILLLLPLSIFSNWTFTRKLHTSPRGGTSQGIPVTRDMSSSSLWNHLQEKGLSNYEKDRRAIYALQGEFKTSFEFLETFLLDTPKKLDLPYASWVTEFVKVIEDRGDFISLQHIMVIFSKSRDGKKHLVRLS